MNHKNFLEKLDLRDSVILAIGNQEDANGTVCVRKLGQQEQEVLKVEDFIDLAKKQIINKS